MIRFLRRVHYVLKVQNLRPWRETDQPTTMTAATLQYSGHLYFRHRLALSILSGKTIKIDKIRPGDKNPGLRGMLPQI